MGSGEAGWFRKWWAYGTTRKIMLLLSVPVGVVTWTVPLVAPMGTVALMAELDTTLKEAAVPLNVTAVVPVRLLPRIMAEVPTLPKAGFVSTNGPRPVERLKIVP